MFSHNTTEFPTTIFLNSANGILTNGSLKSDISFPLKNHIKIPGNVDCYLRLSTFKFTNVFYNINSNNNVFYYSVDDSATILSLTLPVGKYTISSLVTYMNSNLLGAVSFAYSATTFKITATALSTNVCIRASAFLTTLGFDYETDTSFFASMTAPNLINLSGTQLLYVLATNLGLQSNVSEDDPLTNVLAEIHCDKLAPYTQSYVALNESRFKISHSDLTRIDIEIRDQTGNFADFNGIDWYMSIDMIFSYKNVYHPPPRLIINEQQQEEQQKEDNTNIDK